jgi:P2 family phage contractile tail tube protein
MALPTDLKDFALFAEGEYIGDATMTRAPKAVRKVEEWIGGGMAGPVEITDHLEKLDCEFETRGFTLSAYEQFATKELGGIGLRFVGAHQQGNDGTVTQVEHTIRATYKELDSPENKRGEPGNTKVVASVTVWTLTVDGREILHIDMLQGIERYNGTDSRAEIRNALGI